MDDCPRWSWQKPAGNEGRAKGTTQPKRGPLLWGIGARNSRIKCLVTAAETLFRDSLDSCWLNLHGPTTPWAAVAPQPAALLLFGSLTYIECMLSRAPGDRPLNAPAAFIHPCQPIAAKEPPSGPGWLHELKHDGYRLQIHVRDGHVRL